MDDTKAPLPSELYAHLTVTNEQMQDINRKLSQVYDDANLNSEIRIKLSILQNRANELHRIIAQPTRTDDEKELQQLHKIELDFMLKAIQKLAN